MRCLLLAGASVIHALSVSNVSRPSRELQGSGCGNVKRMGFPVVEALVRGHTYTKTEPSGCTFDGASCNRDSLDPICASGASECREYSICGGNDVIDVRFNSRSYVLAEYSGQCDGKEFGDPYTCAPYREGALYLAGKTLSFDLDLSGCGCGCNAAVYLWDGRDPNKRGSEQPNHQRGS